MEQDVLIRLDEINIRVIIKDLLKNLIFILMAAAAGTLLVSSVYMVRYEPEYTASATLAVMARGGSGNSYSNLSTANAMADVLSAVFKSDVMKNEIGKVAGDEAKEARILADLIPETNLLVLKVTAGNPEVTYNIIETVLDNYHSVSDYVFSNAVIEVITDPSVPMSPSNVVNMNRYKKLAAAAGFLAASALIVLCSLLRKTVKSVREAKRKIEGKCIGVVNHEEQNRTLRSRLKRTTKGLLITNPTAGFSFIESFHQLAVQVDHQMRRKGQKVLLVSSVAENEGKTTVAANLALALAKRNKKVLLIDLDLRKPAQYKLFDLRQMEENGLVDYLGGQKTTQKVMRMDRRNRLYQVLNRKAVKNPQELINNGRLDRFLKNARTIMDYIIVDAAPFAAGTDAQRLNEFCDASLLVVRQDRVQASDLNDTIEMLQESGSEYLGCVLNDFDYKAGSGSNYGYGYGHYGYGRYGHYGNYGKSRQTDAED